MSGTEERAPANVRATIQKESGGSKEVISMQNYHTAWQTARYKWRHIARALAEAPIHSSQSSLSTTRNKRRNLHIGGLKYRDIYNK